jgi:hypothetical protein
MISNHFVLYIFIFKNFDFTSTLCSFTNSLQIYDVIVKVDFNAFIKPKN